MPVKHLTKNAEDFNSIVILTFILQKQCEDVGWIKRDPAITGGTKINWGKMLLH
jgi:hypothetical protein